MTWTYGGDPAANSRDAVRFAAGLTDKGDPLVTDEEIAYLLVQASDDVNEAAARALDHLSVVFARYAEAETLLRRKEEYGDRSAKFAARATEVRQNAGLTAAAPRAPQIRQSDRDAALSDTSRTATQFQVGMIRDK